MWTKYFYYFQGLRALKCHRTKRSNGINNRSKLPPQTTLSRSAPSHLDFQSLWPPPPPLLREFPSRIPSVAGVWIFSGKTHWIHRMQIWRTTRLAPGTSRMEARLVRLWCFVLTMLFPKSLALLSTWSFCFALSTRFCVAECHHKRVKSSTAEKAFFFSVISFVS